MTKIATYTIKSNPALTDYVIGTNSVNAQGQPTGETLNFTLGSVQALFLAGLTPETGGTLKINEIVFDPSSELDSISNTVNAMTPPYDVAQYETLFFNYGEQIYLLKPQNITIGYGQDPLSDSDFIAFPVSVGPAGTNGSTIRSASGVPSDSLGVDGDFYINTANGFLYKKVAGAYVYQLTMIGTNGTNGTNGSIIRSGSGVPSNSLGANGDYYLNTANGDFYLKQAGAYTVQFNLKGADGVSVTASGTTTDVTGDGSIGNPYVVELNDTYKWQTGDIKEVYCDSTYLSANFDVTGLGTNERLGWAIMNGNNGTPNHNGKVIIAYGTDYSTLNATGGSKHAVVVSHKHDSIVFSGGLKAVNDTGTGPALTNNVEISTPTGSGNTDETGTTGVSGTNANMQPYAVCLRIMKL